MHDCEAMKFLVKTIGEDRVAMGSDYPFPLGEERPGMLIESLTDLEPATREGLLWRNALEWLGRSKEEFGS